MSYPEKMKNLTAGSLAAISRFFSSSVIREMARKGESALFARLLNESRLLEALPTDAPVGSVFETAFSLLRREGYRHEYIYKAALTHKILLGRHSLRTASMLNEFRVGECKADLAILNGTSTVYEVKSERDSLSRLERQLSAYAKVFAQVYVIVAEPHLDAVRGSVPRDVGIMVLSSRHQISTLRETGDRRDVLLAFTFRRASTAVSGCHPKRSEVFASGFSTSLPLSSLAFNLPFF
jgi:hypothetical protein